MADATFASRRAQLASDGVLYEDEEFPATDSSIYYEFLPGWENIEWKRPGELCDNPRFRIEGASRFDLAQGELGNCWFLSAATTLAMKAELFDQVVLPGQRFNQEYAGMFQFRFWRYGHWMEVTIDDRLPVKNGQLVFCHNRTETDEFWGALLEKAYAKIHGSYQALESGYSHDALVDFTGGIGEFIDLVQEQDSANRIFKTIKRTHRMNSLLGASIDVQEGGSYEDKLDNGLVTGHAYSITKVTELTVDGQKHRIVRLRNPWGCKEWTGMWSDGHSSWDGVTDEQRDNLGLRAEDDGEFWMAFEDVMSNFNSISICHLTPDSVQNPKREQKNWEVVSHHGAWVAGVSAGGCGVPPYQRQYWSNPQYFLRVVDPDLTDDEETCTVVVSLIQKYRRQHKTLEKSATDMEEAIAFDLLKFRDENMDELDEHNYDHRALQMERKMLNYEFLRERAGRFSVDPGLYCIIPCTYAPDTEGEFLLRIATERPIESQEMGASGQGIAQTQPTVSQFDRLFRKHSGQDEVVDARELRQMLNKGLRIEGSEEFSKETSRSLVAWAKYPQSGGTLDYAQCKKAWQEVKRLQGVFQEFDVDDSATLNRKELRKSFQAIGLALSKGTLGAVTRHYCGKQKGLIMDEFVQLGARISLLFEKYRKKGKKTGLSMDEWLETTLLA